MHFGQGWSGLVRRGLLPRDGRTFWRWARGLLVMRRRMNIVWLRRALRIPAVLTSRVSIDFFVADCLLPIPVPETVSFLFVLDAAMTFFSQQYGLPLQIC